MENKSEIKNGAPSIAVTVPTGSSAGEITVLQMVSERSKIEVPVTIESGTTVFAFAPKIFRVICGAIKPTNPIVPPAHTAAETARDPEIKITS